MYYNGNVDMGFLDVNGSGIGRHVSAEPLRVSLMSWHRLRAEHLSVSLMALISSRVKEISNNQRRAYGVSVSVSYMKDLLVLFHHLRSVRTGRVCVNITRLSA